MSFADAKGNLQDTVKFIKLQLRNMYDKYFFVFEKLTFFQKVEYDGIVENLLQLNDGKLNGINNSLVFLMKQLDSYYGKKPMLFIDE